MEPHRIYFCLYFDSGGGMCLGFTQHNYFDIHPLYINGLFLFMSE